MPAFASERLTVGGTAVGLTSATYAPASGPARSAFITVETDQIRFTLDGTTPTSSRGHVIDAGGSLVLQGIEEIRAFKAIRVTNSAPIEVTYKR